MDNIADVLTAQRGTSPLTQYNGNGPVQASPAQLKLQALIAELKSMLADLPPEIAALLMGVLQDAEALLSGGSLGDIDAMIDRLQQIIRNLIQLLQQMQGPGAPLNYEQLQAILHNLAVQMDGNQRAAVMMVLQQLRKLAVGNSLKGIDEVNLGSLDGSNLIEPSQANVINSLQQLIQLAIFRPVTSASGASSALPQNGDSIASAALQSGAIAAAAVPPTT